MSVLGFFKKKPFHFLTKDESEAVKRAIQNAEKKTSGEVRVCIESKCSYIDPLDRAREVFYQLKMNQTTERNAVIIYAAYAHHEFAIFADVAFYEKTSQSYWDEEAEKLKKAFSMNAQKDGIIQCVENITTELAKHYPYHENDKNELPDEIVFGS